MLYACLCLEEGRGGGGKREVRRGARSLRADEHAVQRAAGSARGSRSTRRRRRDADPRFERARCGGDEVGKK